jgi:hypothetical protein
MSGASAGSVVVPTIDHERQGNLGGVALGAWNEGERVPVTTIDALALTAVHLIKIDAEGMENEVVEGATATIRRLRPLVHLENDRPQRSAELIDRLRSLDYRLFWHLPPLFDAKNFLGCPDNVFGKTASVNMLCLPRERAIQVVGLVEVQSADEDCRRASGA